MWPFSLLLRRDPVDSLTILQLRNQVKERDERIARLLQEVASYHVDRSTPPAEDKDVEIKELRLLQKRLEGCLWKYEYDLAVRESSLRERVKQIDGLEHELRMTQLRLRKAEKQLLPKKAHVAKGRK